MAVMNFRVDDQLKTQFEAAVLYNEENSSEVIRKLMKEYIQMSRENRDYEEWFMQNVETGRAQAAAGRTISDIEMRKKSAEWRAKILSANHG